MDCAAYSEHIQGGGKKTVKTPTSVGGTATSWNS